VRARLRLLAGAAVLIGLVAAVYGASIGYDFVFDDQLLVVDNPAVKLPLSSAPALLGERNVGIVYRPLRTLSYMVDHARAGGLDARVFHASNLVDHAAAVLVLFGLARAVVGSPFGALAGAAFFAVHPLNTEAVAYVSGRRDLLATLCVLIALACWRFLVVDPPSGRDRLPLAARRLLGVSGMLLFGVLGLAAKETALVLPALALLLIPARGDGRVAPLGRTASIALVGFCALAALVVWRLYAPTVALGVARLRSGPLAPQPALTLRVLGQYLLLAVWPAGLSADYTTGAFALPGVALDGPSLLAGAALLLFLGAALTLLRRGNAAGVGMLWFVVALLPVAQLVPYREVISEHNAYLAMAGLALAVGEGFARAERARPRLAHAVAVVLVLFLGARSFVRTRVWQNNVTLWTETAQANPRGVRAQYNLGIALMDTSKLFEARVALERAHELDPKDRDVLLALASVSGKLGDFRRAVELATSAIAERADPDALTLLGWSQLNAGDAEAAVATFQRALVLDPHAQAALNGLGLARSRGVRF
jgi:tetratricopeptide (TPR) repeat protein